MPGPFPETFAVEDLERLYDRADGVPAYPEGIGRATKDDGAERAEEAGRYG